MRRILALILALALTAVFSGCQSTPDDPVVVGKNVDILIDKATETDGATVVTETPAPTGPDNRAILAEKLGVPERFVNKESYSDGRLTLDADAEIVLPDVAALPVMRVEPADFSQETVDKLYDYLVGDTTMYQQQWRYTKTQIKDELVSWRQILNDPDSAEESKDQAKEKIAELEEGYDSAPDSASMAPADATIGTQQEIDFQTGKVKAEYNGVDIAEIPGLGINKGKAFSVHNNTKDGEIIVEENVGGWEVTDTASQGARLYYTDYDLTPENMCYVQVEKVTPDTLTDRPEKVCGFSYEEALDTVQDLLTKAGIDDMQVSSISLILVLPDSYNDVLYGGLDSKPSDQEAAMAEAVGGRYDGEAQDVRFEIELVRTADGIPVTSNGSSSYIDDAMFGKQWFYESFKIALCSKGIYSVAWSSPHKIVETVTEDTNMLSFTEIADVFSNMYRVKYDASGSNLAGKVTRVTLTLRRIMEQNNIGYGLFVPVWDFYGSMAVSYPDNPEEGTRDWISDAPLMTINGIDGTVIDLDKGY